ncbi:TIGR02186 family protein [Alteriqipengyuania sp. WL0013]|uniref:TIGR02186 family protein n=1 Tax=Alteriqipengyuania sp. WL0013 TaxID=3110773 RepID=UPI002BB99C18|nr:TIGR02186 family protein [Alteriqipengyuania sp. WL0013]MEB3415893.1 TIGR02186 family protein [Alteriqipengyuania sp. WL0013]
MRLLLAILALVLCTAQREPILVPEVSQHEVALQQGFTGTELLLFGAILDPAGTRAGGQYDIAVVLKGPTEAIRLREKDRIFGVWMNADSTEFRSAPSFYAVASSRPIPAIVDDKTAAIYELGLRWLQLSPVGAIDPEEQARFAAGLVDLRSEQGLFFEQASGVTISDDVLYQARIPLPSNVSAGTYTAETFAIRDGRVLASAVSEVEVRKTGFERDVELFALDSGFWYGLLAICLSILLGWIAGRLFAFI